MMIGQEIAFFLSIASRLLSFGYAWSSLCHVRAPDVSRARYYPQDEGMPEPLSRLQASCPDPGHVPHRAPDTAHTRVLQYALLLSRSHITSLFVDIRIPHRVGIVKKTYVLFKNDYGVLKSQLSYQTM